MNVLQDAVKAAVVERLQQLQSVAARLEQLLGADDVPGLLVCRLGVDADHAASVLEDHASKLEAPR